MKKDEIAETAKTSPSGAIHAAGTEVRTGPAKKTRAFGSSDKTKEGKAKNAADDDTKSARMV